MKRMIVVAVLLFLATLPLGAQTPVTITNPSFEAPQALNADPLGAWEYGTIPGWTVTGLTGLWQPANYASVPDGKVVAFSNGGSLVQDLGIAAQQNTIYTLSVYVGHRPDDLPTTYTLALNSCTLSGKISDIPIGTFAKQTLSCPALTGNLVITLTSAGAQANFDNLSLTAKSAIVPQLQNFQIFGGLRYCTLCDKSAGDDTVTGINLLAGLQVWLDQMDASGTAIGSVTFTMDANGNISGSDNITINATNPLLFTVSVVTPKGTVLSGLFESIAIDPIHLQGQGSIHILIRLDPVTPLKIRGVDWWTGA